MAVIRSKWMLLKTDVSISTISEKIRACSFNEKVGFGFEVLTKKDKYISAKYIEQFQFRDSYVDVYGEENIVESIRFKHLEFEIKELRLGEYLLRLINLPKMSMKFIANLKFIIQDFLSVCDIVINIESFISNLKKNEEVKQFKIRQVVASGINLNRYSRAKVEVLSTLNALEDFRNFYAQDNYTLDKVKSSFRFIGVDVVMELRKTGAMAHSKNISDLLSMHIENNLFNQLSNIID